MLVANYSSVEDEIGRPKSEHECVVIVREEEMIARPHRLSVLDPNDDTTSESVSSMLITFLAFGKSFTSFQILSLSLSPRLKIRFILQSVSSRPTLS